MPAPPAALIGRLRGAIPAATTIELVFDGPPERGLRNERIAAGLVVRYSGGRTRRRGHPDHHRRRADARRRRRLGGAPGRHRRPRPPPRSAPARRPDGRLGLAARVGSAAGRLASPSVGNPTAGARRSKPVTAASRAATATRPRSDASVAGSPGAARRPRRATRGKAPKTGRSLVGCRREHRRRPERRSGPDPRGHVRSSSCPTGASSSACLPVIILLGVVMPFLTVPGPRLARSTWSRKPRVKVAFEEGPRVAEIGPGGEPIFPVGLPHCRRDGLVYPSGTRPSASAAATSSR